MGIALFEDSYWQNFSPISLTRATFDIKVGAKTFFEEHQETPEVLMTREYLAPVTSERHLDCQVNPSSVDSDTVFVNGLLHPAAIYADRLTKISHTFSITAGNRLIVARLSKKDIEYLSHCVAANKKMDIRKFSVEKSTKLGGQNQGLLSEPWEIMKLLENSLAIHTEKMQSESDLDPGVRIIGNHVVAIGKNASIEEGAVLDARHGGIYIGPDAYIETSRIIGPTCVDSKTQVKQFTTIKSSYIGYNCRIAGEVEHSIISDHTNKAHAGFIGHSYFGEWVNVGAMTTTSDLKMTYGNIKMDGKSKINTGLDKLGSFIADMVKTSIGALIYSGRRIGVSAHLYGLVAQDVPGFTIYGSGIGAANVELDLNSAMETQKKMMSRRNQMMSKAYEQMIEHIFSMTAIDRKRAGIRKAKFVL